MKIRDLFYAVIFAAFAFSCTRSYCYKCYACAISL